jgi:hypothetical protein
MKKIPKLLAFIGLAAIAGIYMGLVMVGNFINQINASTSGQ